MLVAPPRVEGAAYSRVARRELCTYPGTSRARARTGVPCDPSIEGHSLGLEVAQHEVLEQLGSVEVAAAAGLEEWRSGSSSSTTRSQRALQGSCSANPYFT